MPNIMEDMKMKVENDILVLETGKVEGETLILEERSDEESPRTSEQKEG